MRSLGGGPGGGGTAWMGKMVFSKNMSGKRLNTQYPGGITRKMIKGWICVDLRIIASRTRKKTDRIFKKVKHLMFVT